jgi:hypothetical protein
VLKAPDNSFQAAMQGTENNQVSGAIFSNHKIYIPNSRLGHGGIYNEEYRSFSQSINNDWNDVELYHSSVSLAAAHPHSQQFGPHCILNVSNVGGCCRMLRPGPILLMSAIKSCPL